MAGPSMGEFKTVNSRLGNVEGITTAVLWVGIISVVGVVVTCCGMVLDQVHFNNQTYKDQSDKNNLQMQQLQLESDALRQQSAPGIKYV
jgi:hypothetical protein